MEKVIIVREGGFVERVLLDIDDILLRLLVVWEENEDGSVSKDKQFSQLMRTAIIELRDCVESLKKGCHPRCFSSFMEKIGVYVAYFEGLAECWSVDSKFKSKKKWGDILNRYSWNVHNPEDPCVYYVTSRRGMKDEMFECFDQLSYLWWRLDRRLRLYCNLYLPKVLSRNFERICEQFSSCPMIRLEPYQSYQNYLGLFYL